MKDNVSISAQHVSKKYCKQLRPSMYYGVKDITRNVLGLSSRPHDLRPHEFWAVDDVSFEVMKGETLAVIGANGSGKTTLLKMLNGIFWPDKGKISIKGRIGALIAVGAGFHPQLTGRENVYVNGAILGMTKKELDAKFDSIIEFAEIGDFIDTAVKYYSSGMFVRLGFAIAVHAEPDVLLVDEVLAVGDEGFQAKCFTKIGELRERGTTTILVSHNMHVISSFADRAMLMKHGKASHYDDVTEGVKAYDALFLTGNGTRPGEITKVYDSHANISFRNARIHKAVLQPGDDLSVRLNYTAVQEFKDVEIDIVLRSSTDRGRYFQATNQAYDKTVDLPSGTHTLAIKLEHVPIHNSMGTLAISIWTTKRTELLFWFDTPIEFIRQRFAHGHNFLNVQYELET